MRRRFIAGAVCPKCKEMDKTVLYEQNGAQVRECVSCGFNDALDELGLSQELPTRVNKSDVPTSDVQVVTLVDPKA